MEILEFTYARVASYQSLRSFVRFVRHVITTVASEITRSGFQHFDKFNAEMKGKIPSQDNRPALAVGGATASANKTTASAPGSAPGQPMAFDYMADRALHDQRNRWIASLRTSVVARDQSYLGRCVRARASGAGLRPVRGMVRWAQPAMCHWCSTHTTIRLLTICVMAVSNNCCFTKFSDCVVISRFYAMVVGVAKDEKYPISVRAECIACAVQYAMLDSSYACEVCELMLAIATSPGMDGQALLKPCMCALFDLLTAGYVPQ